MEHLKTTKQRIPHVDDAASLSPSDQLAAHEKGVAKAFEQARAGHIELHFSQEDAPMLADGRTGVRVITDRYETDPGKLHAEDKEYKDGAPA